MKKYVINIYIKKINLSFFNFETYTIIDEIIIHLNMKSNVDI